MSTILGFSSFFKSSPSPILQPRILRLSPAGPNVYSSFIRLLYLLVFLYESLQSNTRLLVDEIF